jgi:hypothetical protein
MKIMSNPLLDKFDEIYGKPKVETEEETKEESIDKRAEVLKEAEEEFDRIIGSHTPFTTSSIGITSVTPPPKGTLSINGGGELTVFDGSNNVVIPTGTVSNGSLHMDGSWVTPNTITSHVVKQKMFTIDPQNEIEEQFCRILRDVTDKRAIITGLTVNSDGGGRLNYSIEIQGTYP